VKFIETKLAGCFVLEQELRGDDRGNFARVFCVDEMSAHGLCTDVAQGTISAHLMLRINSYDARLVASSMWRWICERARLPICNGSV